jgi:hypothetical protein
LIDPIHEGGSSQESVEGREPSQNTSEFSLKLGNTLVEPHKTVGNLEPKETELVMKSHIKPPLSKNDKNPNI